MNAAREARKNIERFFFYFAASSHVLSLGPGQSFAPDPPKFRVKISQTVPGYVICACWLYWELSTEKNPQIFSTLRWSFSFSYPS